MVHTGQIKLFGLAIMAALAAFVMAMAIAPAAQAADLSQDQAAPQAMQDNGDDENGVTDDENGVTDDENGVTDDDENGVTDDDENGVTDDDENGVTDDDENGVTDDENGVMDDEDGVTDDDEDLAPAETGGAGLLGSSTGTALGGLLLGLGALAALMTAGRFATRQQ